MTPEQLVCFLGQLCDQTLVVLAGLTDRPGCQVPDADRLLADTAMEVLGGRLTGRGSEELIRLVLAGGPRVSEAAFGVLRPHLPGLPDDLLVELAGSGHTRAVYAALTVLGPRLRERCDEHLVGLVLDANRPVSNAACDVLLARYVPILFRYFRRRVTHRGRAEELAVECGGRLFEWCRKYNPAEGFFIRYVYGAARHWLADQFRVRPGHPNYPPPGGGVGVPDVAGGDDPAAAFEEREELDRLLSRLPPFERYVLEQYLDGRGPQEIVLDPRLDEIDPTMPPPDAEPGTARGRRYSRVTQAKFEAVRLLRSLLAATEPRPAAP